MTLILPPLRPRVWIDGSQRTDAVVRSIVKSAGLSAGQAEIEFPAFNYATDSLEHGSIVVIDDGGVNVLFRGFISSERGASFGSVVANCLDFREHLNDCSTLVDFNVKNERTHELDNPAAANVIAAALAAGYQNGQVALYGENAILLEFDLDSFPTCWGKEQCWRGTPIGSALEQLLKSISKSLSLRVVHGSETSTVSCFDLSVGTDPVTVRSPQSPNYSISNQPGGAATAGRISKSLDTADTISHVYGEGDKLVLERPFRLVPLWDEENTDFISQTLAHWQLYTEGEREGAPNKYFSWDRAAVCAAFKVPRIDDIWSLDGGTTWQGQYNRQVPLLDRCVQRWTPGSTDENDALKPFLICKLQGVDRTDIWTTGFEINDSFTVTSEHPIAERLDTVTAMANDGHFVSLASGKSVYASPSTDFISACPDIGDGGKFWLYFGEIGQAYPVDSVGSNEVTVVGDLTGFGATSGTGVAKGAEFMVLTDAMVLAHGTAGVGGASGSYTILDTEHLPEHFLGATLALGAYDAADLHPTASPLTDTTYVHHRVTKASRLDNGHIVLIIEDAASLSGVSASWKLLPHKFEKFRPYEWVELVCAYESVRRLNWTSPLLTDTNVRLIAYAANQDYRWEATNGTWKLTYVDGKPGFKPDLDEDDQPVWTDVVNDLTSPRAELPMSLADWALSEHQGRQYAKIEYQVEFPAMAADAEIGDRLVLNTDDTGASAVEIRHDFTGAGRTEVVYRNRM